MDKYILFDANNFYKKDNRPLVTVFETREDALLKLFGPMEDYFEEEENIEYHTLENYFKYRIMDYVKGEGDSYKSIFKINTETNIVEIIV